MPEAGLAGPNRGAELVLQRAFRSWEGLADRLPVGVYVCDRKGAVTFCNRRALEIWGGTPRAREALDAISPVAEALATGATIKDREVVIEHQDGRRTHALATVEPLFDDEGALVGALNCLQDVTELRGRSAGAEPPGGQQAEVELKRAEDLQKVLLDELNHRVKNTLATVQSLAAHSFHGSGDPTSMCQAFEARLMALSGAHNRLAERRWQAGDLRDVASGVLAAYGPEVVLWDGPSVQLSTRASVAFAMVLHELATNAATHGALSSPAGRLLVQWSDATGELALEWQESRGPAVTPPAHWGFGLKFVRGAVERELSGRAAFDFAEGGFCCRISAPIPAAV